MRAEFHLTVSFKREGSNRLGCEIACTELRRTLLIGVCLFIELLQQYRQLIRSNKHRARLQARHKFGSGELSLQQIALGQRFGAMASDMKPVLRDGFQD